MRKEIKEYEEELEETDKIADKIHKKYEENYIKLKDICKEDNMQVEDFLYIMGYHSLKDYLEELEG